MGVRITKILAELNTLLQPEQFSDYCPNGLQIEGSKRVSKLITGVTACKSLIEEAIKLEAGAILVHHGYFWRGEDQVVTGLKRDRIKSLLAHDINLLAYHLPLDVHPELGNNVQLGKLLGLEISGSFARQGNYDLGLLGQTERELTGEEFRDVLREKLAREPLWVDGSSGKINRVAWCTGAAQNFIQQAVESGADAFVTGEVSEQTVHVARESGIHFFAAGHHATERYGVQAVGRYLADVFNIEHRFIDIDNPA